MSLTDQQRALVAPYVSSTDSNVFALSGLPEEVVAVLFAYYARSADDLRTNLARLLADKELAVAEVSGDEFKFGLANHRARQFHEKWVVGYGHACYDAATEVLTDQGWLSWPHLVGLSDVCMPKLATLNPTTNEVEFLAPTRLIAEPFNGEMYKVTSKFVDLLVTPNHRLWTARRTTKAGRKSPTFELVEAAKNDGVSCCYQIGGAKWLGNKSAKPHISVELAELMGFFIGDGSADKRYANAVMFHMRRKRKIAYLRGLAKRLGFELREHKGDHYYLKGNGVGALMLDCYDGNGEKIIPSGILEMDKHRLQALWHGLQNSDGSVGIKNDLVYDTTSVRLRDQIMDLVMRLGWAASFSLLDDSTEATKANWRVFINRSRLRPEVNKVKYRKQDGWESYVGMVYCAEMPRNHVLYVRRNHRPVWCGNSVAEHAVVHLAMEGVSILASKAIEDMRLSSATEKSTRYVVFTNGSFRKLDDDLPHALAKDYEASCRDLFDTYLHLLPLVSSKLEERYERKPDQTQSAYDAMIRARALDLVRGLLPASTLTNLGLTANARTLANGIAKLQMHHQLREARVLAMRMREHAETVVPTLLRHAEPSGHMDELSNTLRVMADDLAVKALGRTPRSRFAQEFLDSRGALCRMRMVRHDEDAAMQVALGLVCDGQSPMPITDQLKADLLLDWHDDECSAWTESKQYAANRQIAIAIAREALQVRGPHDQAPRAFEHAHITVEFDLDYGAYRDLARHRMLSPAHRMLTCLLGYDVPDGLAEMGYDSLYREALERAASTWARIAQYDPMIAQYAVPLAYRTRVLWTMNLREAIHVIELRSGKQGHASYRKVAQDLFRAIAMLYPWLADVIRVDMNEYRDAR